MNNEEAIKYGIEWLEDEHLYAGDRAFIELALEALKQMPVTTTAGEGGVIYYPQVEGVTPTVIDVGKQEPCEMTAEEYRQRMIQAFHNADTDELIAVCVLPTEKEFEHLEWLLKNHYKKEPCGDAIDRAEAIKIASGYCHPANVAKELAKLPAVNLQESVYCDRNICIQNEYNGIGCEDCEVAKSQKLCEDTISRQAVLDIVDSYSESRSNVEDVTQDMISDILALPTVTPQPKTGHWEQYGNFWEDKFKCSECGKEQPKILCGERIIGHWSDYCPNCGARMVEPQES